MNYSEKKLVIAAVADELAETDIQAMSYEEWEAWLMQAARKLAYWLEQDINWTILDDAQQAIRDLEKIADGTDLEHEGLSGPDTPENREFWRDYFNRNYTTAVIMMIGVTPRG